MARYIVLAVESDHDARLLVKELQRYNEVTVDMSHLGPGDHVNAVPVEVVASVKKPTQICTCDTGQRRVSGFTKGTTFGWWMHARCGKPTATWAASYQAVIGSANNLLEVDRLKEEAAMQRDNADTGGE